MVLRVSRQYIEILGDSVTIIEKSAENTLALSQSAAGFVIVDGASTLTPTQSATALIDEFTRDSTSSLTLTQALSVIGPITVNAESLLSLSQLAHNAQSYEVSAENTLALTQAVGQFGTHRESAENTLTIAQNADTTDKFRNISNTLGLTQSATGVASKNAVSILVFSQLAGVIQETQNITHTLTITQEATIPHSLSSNLNLTQEAVFVPPSPVRQIDPQWLTLTQTADVVTVSTKAFSNTLNLYQGVAYTLEKSDTHCKYTPFIGANSDPDAPTPPPASLPAPNTPAFTKGVELRHPSGGSPTTTVSLSVSMNIGDIDRLEFDRVLRETRGGTLEVYADPIWPKTQKLLFTVSNICADEIAAVRNFIETYVGQEIGLLTHEGRLWSGVVMNPSESIVQDGKDRYTVNIEFEGSED